jgi:hypothetical protein
MMPIRPDPDPQHWKSALGGTRYKLSQIEQKDYDPVYIGTVQCNSFSVGIYVSRSRLKIIIWLAAPK